VPDSIGLIAQKLRAFWRQKIAVLGVPFRHKKADLERKFRYGCGGGSGEGPRETFPASASWIEML
jgi:hypothetical protein